MIGKSELNFVKEKNGKMGMIYGMLAPLED